MGRVVDFKQTAIEQFGLLRFRKITQLTRPIKKIKLGFTSIQVQNWTGERTEPLNRTGGIFSSSSLSW